MTSATKSSTVQTVDLKLEVVVIPVSDVDRAKRFYDGLGWRLDADFAVGRHIPGRAVHAAGLAEFDLLRHGADGGRARLGKRALPRRVGYRGRRAPSLSVAAPT